MRSRVKIIAERLAEASRFLEAAPHVDDDKRPPAPESKRRGTGRRAT
jgi:hypothetical protein